MAKKFVTLSNLNNNLKEYTKSIIMPLLSKIKGAKKPVVIEELPTASEETLYATYIVGDKEYITVEVAPTKENDPATYEWVELGDASEEDGTCAFADWSESEKAGNGKDAE